MNISKGVCRKYTDVVYFEKSMKRLKITIIGGSLGGLFAGIVLKNLGHEVKIYEKSGKNGESRGAGLVVQPEIIDYLQKHGVDIKETLCLPVEYRRFIYKDGTLHHQTKLPQLMTSWEALTRQLRDIFPENLYHRNKRLTKIEQDADGVKAVFLDGSSVKSDLLIGADGAQSTVRSILYPKNTPRYAGYVAWRGVVEEGNLPKEVVDYFDHTCTFFRMPNSHILIYFIPGKNGEIKPGQRRLNWVWYLNLEDHDLTDLLTDTSGVRRFASVPSQMIKQKFVEDMRTCAEQELPDAFISLIRATKSPFIQAIMDNDVPSMYSRRAVLLGDAAFLIRPHTGSGTAKAAKDAIALGNFLESCSNTDEALSKWNKQQMELGTELMNYGIDLGVRSQNVTPHILIE
jgi:2-polyprenyl-6-methoxyphenol hydroxylase-like FAD-dependent oxidoreductase